MATVLQNAFLKAMQQVETKIAEVERTASVQQMANDASLKSIREEITQHAETVVNQAAAKFTQLQLQSRELQTLASNIIHGAKTEFESFKQVLSETTQGINNTVAILTSRIDTLENDVTRQFQC